MQSFYVLYLPVLNEAGDLPEYRLLRNFVNFFILSKM